MDTLEEVQQKAGKGEIDRPGLIKTLRKIRMGAIEAGNKKVLEFFDGPIEVIADRLLQKSETE